MQPLRPALKELVDSAMEQRRYEWQRIPDEHPAQETPMGTFVSSRGSENMSKTQAYCFEGRQTLEHGVAWSMNDPPGIPPRGSIYNK